MGITIMKWYVKNHVSGNYPYSYSGQMTCEKLKGIPKFPIFTLVLVHDFVCCRFHWPTVIYSLFPGQ